MHKFKVPLTLADDAENQPVFGFERDGVFITDPFVSDCGRFHADPVKAYEISLDDATALVALNEALGSAVEAAVSAGCKVLQEKMGVASGDTAGAHFSNRDNYIGIAESLAKYLEVERASQ